MNKKLILALYEKRKNGVFPALEAEAACCVDIIRRAFQTVAQQFGLTEENCPTHTSFFTPERLQHELQQGCRPYVLYRNGEAVGYVSLLRNRKAYVLNHLAVLPAHRNQGCGESLLTFCKQQVLQARGKKIQIHIIAEHTALKGWYEKYGFAYTGTVAIAGLPFQVGTMEWITKNA